MKTKTKVWIGLGVYLAIAIALLVIFGNEGKNEDFKPQNEFKLPAWVHLKVGPIDLSINRAVFYLALACGLTIVTMVWIARKMQQRPNRTQAAVEIAYERSAIEVVNSGMTERAERDRSQSVQRSRYSPSVRVPPGR